jgi:uncharacterized protein DUF5655
MTIGVPLRLHFCAGKQNSLRRRGHAQERSHSHDQKWPLTQQRRIHKSEQTSARRYHHEVKLTSAAEVNAELLKWLKGAYALSG